MANFNMDDYVDVAERIRQFRDKHPEGTLQPFNPDKPFDVVQVGEQWFVVCVEAAYRNPEDPRPGVGTAWEPFPGKTQFTRDSELMNAQTGAWGRAIVAVLAADTKRIASAEDVRNRQPPKSNPLAEAKNRVWVAAQRLGWDAETLALDYAREHAGEAIADATTGALNEYAQRLEISTPDVSAA